MLDIPATLPLWWDWAEQVSLRASLTCSSTLHGSVQGDKPTRLRTRSVWLGHPTNPFWKRAKSVLTEPHGAASTCGFRITHQPHGGRGDSRWANHSGADLIEFT